VLLTVASTSEFVIPTEKVRAVSGDQVEVRFTASSELVEKFERLKGLLAHKNPNLKLADLIDQLCDLGLERWSRGHMPADNLNDGGVAKASRAQKSAQVSAQKTQNAVEPGDQVSLRQTMPQAQTAPARNLAKISSGTKPTSLASIRRSVWREARGRCANCASHFALEIDHRVPKALGGTNSRENLRLLCRSCNQRAAIERIGLQHMEIYLNG
jgi:hypothetical protein